MSDPKEKVPILVEVMLYLWFFCVAIWVIIALGAFLRPLFVCTAGCGGAP